MPEKPYWFADEADEDDWDDGVPPDYRWRPYLQTDSGMCIPLEGIWFGSKDQCEGFIRDTVLKATEIDAT